MKSLSEVEVALRKESVDRNTGCKAQNLRDFVALRKESVDRNHIFPLQRCDTAVALRKESVDRNIRCHLLNIPAGSRSPQGERG